MSAILEVVCTGKNDKELLTVTPFVFSREKLKEFYEAAKKYPVLFGKELKTFEDFIEIIFRSSLDGEPEPSGIYWEITKNGKIIGMLYLTDIFRDSADAHFSFFDGRFRGRQILISKMMQFVFKHFNFLRLNVSIPSYAGSAVVNFVLACGFKREGRRRKAVRYKGDIFDVDLFGILKGEVNDG